MAEKLEEICEIYPGVITKRSRAWSYIGPGPRYSEGPRIRVIAEVLKTLYETYPDGFSALEGEKCLLENYRYKVNSGLFSRLAQYNFLTSVKNEHNSRYTYFENYWSKMKLSTKPIILEDSR